MNEQQLKHQTQEWPKCYVNCENEIFSNYEKNKEQAHYIKLWHDYSTQNKHIRTSYTTNNNGTVKFAQVKISYNCALQLRTKNKDQEHSYRTSTGSLTHSHPEFTMLQLESP